MGEANSALPWRALRWTAAPPSWKNSSRLSTSSSSEPLSCVTLSDPPHFVFSSARVSWLLSSRRLSQTPHRKRPTLTPATSIARERLTSPALFLCLPPSVQRRKPCSLARYLTRDRRNRSPSVEPTWTQAPMPLALP